MIRLRRRPLRHSDQAGLQVWQRRLNGVLPYDQRIGTTWTTFSRTELRGRVNRWVRYQSLRRCIYCERSECETIDLALLREQSALRAVLREVMADLAPRDKLLVGYCLERSKRVRHLLQAIAWL